MGEKSKEIVKPRRPIEPAATKGAGIKISSRRVTKNRVLERIKQDTSVIRGGSLLPDLRRQGYEELPLDEIQERLSKIEHSLSEFILAGRGS